METYCKVLLLMSKSGMRCLSTIGMTLSTMDMTEGKGLNVQQNRACL
jgi:hypothetical protein